MRILEYIEKVLGIKAEIEQWDGKKQLPLYLQAKRNYYILTFEDEQCLLVQIKADDFSLSAFQKQIVQLRRYTDMAVVLCLDAISSYQRQSLIKNKIAFIVPDCQLYVPMWGISLKEYFQNRTMKVEKMTAMAQYMLLYMMYQPDNRFYTMTELSQKLENPAMTISRSVQELEQLAFVEVKREGRNKLVRPVSCGKELYKMSKDYMQSPVQKKIYVAYEHTWRNLPIAGEDALARKSMLNPPKHRVCAIDRKKIQYISDKDIVDPNWSAIDSYIELEIWKYNPELLAEDGIVDVVSLVLSFENTDDERIEMQVSQMMEEYRW